MVLEWLTVAGPLAWGKWPAVRSQHDGVGRLPRLVTPVEYNYLEAGWRRRRTALATRFWFRQFALAADKLMFQLRMPVEAAANDYQLSGFYDSLRARARFIC